MSTMAQWMGASLIVALAGGTAVRGYDAKEVTGDLKAMQGTWTYATSDGGEGRWVFENDTLTVSLPTRKYVARVTLDSKAKPHPAIDFKIVEGPDDAAGKTRLGIYKLEADNLTFCIGAADSSRPQAFEQVEQQSFLFALKKK